MNMIFSAFSSVKMEDWNTVVRCLQVNKEAIFFLYFLYHELMNFSYSNYVRGKDFIADIIY